MLKLFLILVSVFAFSNVSFADLQKSDSKPSTEEVKEDDVVKKKVEEMTEEVKGEMKDESKDDKKAN